jgi:hypothetical protein
MLIFWTPHLFPLDPCLLQLLISQALNSSLLASSQVLTVKIRQPSHEFTFGVGISFIPYPLVLSPVV